MGFEKFALEQTERIIECEQISEVMRSALMKICSKFEEFKFTSPWKDKVETILKNGNKLTVGKAKAKVIESPRGDVLVYRRFEGFGPDLPDGSPTLRFRLQRPSGTTYLYVKPNINGGFSLARL